MNDKKLTKSATNRMISGVCGGIGEYFHLDATLIRLIWAILTVGEIGRASCRERVWSRV